MNSQTTLDGRVALVTGSAKRIGRAIVERLHDAGARVAIHYRRSADEARSFAESLNAKRPGSAQYVAANLGNTADLTALADSVLGWAGRLDILVNNASSFYPTPIGNITEDDWNELIDSNFKGPLFLTQACLPALQGSRRIDRQHRRHTRAESTPASSRLQPGESCAGHADTVPGQGSGTQGARQRGGARRDSLAERRRAD